jgi:hypothetical protein
MSTYLNAYHNRELLVTDDGEHVHLEMRDDYGTALTSSLDPKVAREMAAELIRLADVLDPQGPANADQGKGSLVAVFQERGQFAGDPARNNSNSLSLIRDIKGGLIEDFEAAVDYMAGEMDNSWLSELEVLELTVVRRATIRRSVEVMVA